MAAAHVFSSSGPIRRTGLGPVSTAKTMSGACCDPRWTCRPPRPLFGRWYFFGASRVMQVSSQENSDVFVCIDRITASVYCLRPARPGP